eukprot:TRINITY_DN113045_c0_g1_i1.p1 TRINITY_DN113045_c0_g1~~TRINITY_DN113045_c0_g1_i1.p1  ORF type:complete len:378 (+),score=75.09 TRINITY_DN113045_c0_g1_i1:157-1290(+)
MMVAPLLLLVVVGLQPCHAGARLNRLRHGLRSHEGPELKIKPSEEHWGSGSRSLSFAPDTGLPSRQLTLDAEDRLWARGAYKERKAQVQPALEYTKELKGLFSGDDDNPETFIGQSLKDFEPLDQRGMWDELCASVEDERKVLPENVKTNCSVTDGSSGSSAYPCRCGSGGAICNSTNELCFKDSGVCKAIQPLDDYEVVKQKTCAVTDILEGPVIGTELEAYLACDGDCSAVLDVGCQRTSFRLCKMGAVPEDSESSTCLRLRVPGHAPPTATPRGPLYKKFWKRFCNLDMTHAFRLLFEGRLCDGETISLGDTWTVARCSEEAGTNPECGDVFDFTKAPKGKPSECRCVKKDEDCAAKAPTGPLAENKNVFLRTR